MKYYLVSPGAETQGRKKKPFYWSLDEGGHWTGVARGIQRPKDEKDIVKEVVDADHLTQLDWSKTPFFDNSLSTGWLSRDGRFYGCPAIHHDIMAFCVLGMKVPELERLGWVRVHPGWFTCEKRLSPEQMNWLSERGFPVSEDT